MIKSRPNTSSLQRKSRPLWKGYLRVWSICMKDESCTETSSLRIYCWENKMILIVWLQISGLRPIVIKSSTCLWDVGHRDMWRRRLSTWKISQPSMSPFVIFLVLELFFTWSRWENRLFLDRSIMRFSLKIERAKSIFLKICIKRSLSNGWIWWKECSKKIRRKESMQLKL